MSRFTILLALLVILATANTILAIFEVFRVSQGNTVVPDLSSFVSASPVEPVIRGLQRYSGILAPASWLLVVAASIWRGRTRSTWTRAGFNREVFELFVRMRGGVTRLRLLSALAVPKDRLQLAQELGLDWKAVDRHVQILSKYGFIREHIAYGKVRMYELTAIGKLLLELLSELKSET